MSQYYYGTIGKQDGWFLLADKPIILWSSEGEFKGFDSITEADKAFVSPGEHQRVYFCQAGKWHEVNFLVGAAETKSAIGFTPN